ncbi:flagellar hook-basal body complex protein FliE [Cedecea neteri]|uniref:flagellar hook-basal body complex protein FliE n=1 Tax=Cedecea neteri TaxID=158822 RepID=UPI0005D80EAC|nr:flagellar hook-basal body complex protein FliE [Cedecea neteri]AJZ88515.1 flagellar hook-basal body protein FliE [Klebsiella michiganensis]WPU21893.1 flagellar hook-basal body complex protein FliE [Cedecea neteri]
MDKISGLGMPAGQQEMLMRLQQTAASAGSGAISAAPVLASTGTGAATPVSFGNVLTQAINNVDQMQHAASARQAAIDTGQSDDLTGAMIESQKASVAFTAMMQVRNKLTTALDEVMNIAL